jgi:uncharacterized protein YdgA (DUF945 family)
VKDWVQMVGVVVGILATLAGGAYFLGCKLFATRKELHDLKNTDEALKLADEGLRHDVDWLKSKARK